MMIIKHICRQMGVWVSILAFVALSIPVRALEVGKNLSDFSLQGLDGRTYVASDYRGKVLVLYLMGYA